MTSVAPHQSMRGLPRSPNFGRCRNVSTMNRAMMPIGTLIRNTQRQPAMNSSWSAPANTPPTSGPMTDEMPKTARK